MQARVDGFAMAADADRWSETMLKKTIALATALTFALAVPALAAEGGTKRATPFKSGTISSWDAAAKQGAVKDAKGVETAFVWNEKTTLAGTPKVGEHAFVWYKESKDGKVIATHVSIGQRLAMKKTPGAAEKIDKTDKTDK
jgi:uncharacterized protein YpmB